MPDSSKEWEVLRKEARKLENEIDKKLLQLSKCDQSSPDDHDDEPSDKAPLIVSSSLNGTFGTLSKEIESLLQRLSDLNQQMSSISENIRSASATYTLQRHRDILKDYTQEFRKTKTKVENTLDREQLFSRSSSSRKENMSETRIQMHSKTSELLNKEMESARNTELLVDEQIDTVLRTRESLMNQKAALKAIHSQMTTLANRFPMINSLIQRINIKKRKDTIILASVIGVCLFLLVLWAF